MRGSTLSDLGFVEQILGVFLSLSVVDPAIPMVPLAICIELLVLFRLNFKHLM